MFQLKPLPPEAIDKALEKAERYRLLNEPRQAESIYRDILDAQPSHPAAQTGLVLALTDAFGGALSKGRDEPLQIAAALADDYQRAYYQGIVCERSGDMQLDRCNDLQAGLIWLRQGMEHFELAERLASDGSADAILRWNACARVIQRVEPQHETTSATPHLDGDLPLE